MIVKLTKEYLGLRKRVVSSYGARYIITPSTKGGASTLPPTAHTPPSGSIHTE